MIMILNTWWSSIIYIGFLLFRRMVAVKKNIYYFSQHKIFYANMVSSYKFLSIIYIFCKITISMQIIFTILISKLREKKYKCMLKKLNKSWLKPWCCYICPQPQCLQIYFKSKPIKQNKLKSGQDKIRLDEIKSGRLKI